MNTTTVRGNKKLQFHQKDFVPLEAVMDIVGNQNKQDHRSKKAENYGIEKTVYAR